MRPQRKKETEPNERSPERERDPRTRPSTPTATPNPTPHPNPTVILDLEPTRFPDLCRACVAAVLLVTAVSGLGCWEMLPASREPLLDAQHREPLVCAGLGPQRYPEGLFDPRSVISAEPLTFARSTRGSQDQHLLGATLGVLPPPGVSSEELERLLNCHAARAQLAREGEPVFADDPYWLAGHVVHISVHFDRGATRVEIEARDVEGAKEILRRAIALAQQGRQLEEVASFNAFHARRLERLRAPDGWLTLVGLVWLQEGDNRVGLTEPVRLPEGWPAHLGTFTRHGDRVSFAGKLIPLAPEGESDPLLFGPLRLTVIRRGDRVGLRLRDPGSPVRANLHDIPAFPPTTAWRLTARFEPAPAGRTLDIQNVLGQVQATPSPGTAVFDVGARTYRLTAVIDDPGHLFFVFGDLTNRDSTYGAGRFLTTELPQNGQVVLDFNQAINPPCAFTAFATCPIPPKENRLLVRVEAGELRAGEHP